MLQGEHSAILLNCTKLIICLETIFWSSFEWPLKTGFNVQVSRRANLTCLYTGLSLTWSGTQKTGFLMMRPIKNCVFIFSVYDGNQLNVQ